MSQFRDNPVAIYGFQRHSLKILQISSSESYWFKMSEKWSFLLQTFRLFHYNFKGLQD